MESLSVGAGSRKFRALGKDLVSYASISVGPSTFFLFSQRIVPPALECYSLLVLTQALNQISDIRKGTIYTEVACQSFIPFSEVVSLSTPTRDMGYVLYHYCPARKQYMYDTGTGFEMVLYPTNQIVS